MYHSSRVTPDALTTLALRYSETDSPALTVEIGLHRHLNRDHCRALENDLEAFLAPWEVLSATDALGEQLPSVAGLYMFVWRPSFTFRLANGEPTRQFQVLYVGKAGGAGSSGTIRTRYAGYRKYISGDPEQIWAEGTIPTRREGLLARYLPLRPLEYWYCEAKEPSRLSMLEDRLIKLLNPPLNSRQGPSLRARRPQPAFSS